MSNLNRFINRWILIIGDLCHRCFETFIYGLVVWLHVFLLIGDLEAANRATLIGELNKEDKSLSFFLKLPQRQKNCSALLYAAKKAKFLRGNFAKASLIENFNQRSDDLVLTASNLPSINGKNKVFFRVQLNCSGKQKLSNVAKLKLSKDSSASFSDSISLIEGLNFFEPEFGTEVAFPNINFSTPIDLQNNNSENLFIAEQAGTIKRFENTRLTNSSSEFLNIEDLVKFQGEHGLLGLAFHPQFKENGYFFVHYSAKGTGDTVIARYTADKDLAVDKNSASIIYTTEQPGSNHNGGQIAFGPDGFLYIALGDGGGAGDPFKNGQNLKTPLGALLRIDVDQTTTQNNYSIPNGNPFKKRKVGLNEIWAYGLRNPFRFSFDSLTGTLWLGDVGQDEVEEINIIKRGKNYGWNTLEGNKCFNPASNCKRMGLVKPKHTYSHDIGSSITGGYVYRGSKLSFLKGFYIYADFVRGQIWGLKQLGKKFVNLLLVDTDLNISSFGVDQNQELYFLDYTSGDIYQLV